MDTVDVERYRKRLLGIAYRILGTMSDAEDVAQETFLRWYHGGHSTSPPEAWLITVATRHSIDRLRARKKEQYLGPWRPEPVASDVESNPEARAVAEADLSLAYLWMLERLSPEERAALLLREVFGYSYQEIASILERSVGACRQSVSRAKKSVKNEKRGTIPENKDDLLRHFLHAMQTRDEAALVKLVASDARWIADGGGKIVGAATHIVNGHDRVSRMAFGVSRKFEGKVHGEIIGLLGEAAIAWKMGDHIFDVMSIASDGKHIGLFLSVLNPQKLRHLAA
jgi:RNA polymerase sigma-70 factor, ECF subfamily